MKPNAAQGCCCCQSSKIFHLFNHTSTLTSTAICQHFYFDNTEELSKMFAWCVRKGHAPLPYSLFFMILDINLHIYDAPVYTSDFLRLSIRYPRPAANITFIKKWTRCRLRYTVNLIHPGVHLYALNSRNMIMWQLAKCRNWDSR